MKVILDANIILSFLLTRGFIIAGKAHYLVSRDKADLLAIKRYEYTTFITAKEFLEKLKQQDFS